MELQGIDMEAGLAAVNNDEEVYREILQIYYADGVELLDELKNNIQRTDLKLFITHVHALKSASKGIGANEVSERFKEMEFAGKEEDMEKIEQRLPSCLAGFEQLLDEIKQYAKGRDGEDAGTNNYEKMKAALEEMDTDVFEALLEQEEQRAADEITSSKLHEIRTAYEDFDFAEVETMLEELL